VDDRETGHSMVLIRAAGAIHRHDRWIRGSPGV
jgi:hypothetical protein